MGTIILYIGIGWFFLVVYQFVFRYYLDINIDRILILGLILIATIAALIFTIGIVRKNKEKLAINSILLFLVVTLTSLWEMISMHFLGNHIVLLAFITLFISLFIILFGYFRRSTRKMFVIANKQQSDYLNHKLINDMKLEITPKIEPAAIKKSFPMPINSSWIVNLDDNLFILNYNEDSIELRNYMPLISSRRLYIEDWIIKKLKSSSVPSNK